MEALFVGHAYIDITILAESLPKEDEKTIANDFAVSFGGNAVTAAFCFAKLGGKPDVLVNYSDDWFGMMLSDMARKYSVTLHSRRVARSSLSLVIPNNGKRAILRMRDDKWLHPYPPLNVDDAKVLHLDGHQHDAALHYAVQARRNGTLVSLDGGAVRSNTDDLLEYVDVAVVAERFCEQMERTPSEVLHVLRAKGVKVGGVTMGERGMLWFEGSGPEEHLPALPVPRDLIVDTNGAGDVFHGAYVWAYAQDPSAPWSRHFRFARAASAHAIQHLGNEAKLPTVSEVLETAARYGDPIQGIMTR